jgi:hypothetical protein
MLKFVRAAAIGAALLSPALLAPPAAALGVYSGTVTGTFTNLQTTGPFINTDGTIGQDTNGADAFYSGGGTSAISWGDPGGQPGFTSSTLSFTGDSFFEQRSFDPEDDAVGQIFKIGTLTYYNGTSVTGTLLYGADLDLEVGNATKLGEGGVQNVIDIGGVDLSLGFLSTVNTNTTPARDADFLTFNDLGATFNVVEGGTATIDIYAEIVGDPQMFYDHIQDPTGDGFIGNGIGGGVPEPASWALMIAGFGGVGAVLRRRRVAAVAA